MPSLLVHCYIDRLHFGRAYRKLHKEIDKPVKIFGRGHRFLYHDYATAVNIAGRLYPGDSNAKWAAILHIEYDRMCSDDPEFRKILENEAKKDARKRKKRRKKH